MALDNDFDELSRQHAEASSIRELSVPCSTCGAQPTEGCRPDDLAARGRGETLPYFHTARIEAAAFDAALTQPGENHPITADLINGADVV